ncbi:MAG: ABC transporter permease [Fimbriimonadaceae bacterium]
MNILQSVVIALEMLRQHKLRAFLTMLGVIIGVMSVTLIVLVSNGFKAYLDAQFQSLGSDTIFLFYDPFGKMRGQDNGGIENLTTDDMQYLLNRVSAIDLASGEMSVPSQKVVYGVNTMDDPQIHAVDANFQTLNRFKLVAGRAITPEDVSQRASVCLIGEDVRDRLFPQPGATTGKDNPDSPEAKAAAAAANQEAMGKLVMLNGIALQVVGIIQRKNFLGDNTGRILMLPITTAQMKWLGGNKLDVIYLRARPNVSDGDAMEAVWEAMMARSDNRTVYRVDSNQSISGVFTGLSTTAGAILAAVAALSLLVGGIGIMNIMLVSVTERTKEIGLRKALGARRSAILMQFLIEAGTLSLVGGLIGMAIAWGMGQVVTIVTMFKHWPTAEGLTAPFPVSAAIMAAAFSAVIGMVFGFYPAMSASQLDPIVALRTE